MKNANPTLTYLFVITLTIPAALAEDQKPDGIITAIEATSGAAMFVASDLVANDASDTLRRYNAITKRVNRLRANSSAKVLHHKIKTYNPASTKRIRALGIAGMFAGTTLLSHAAYRALAPDDASYKVMSRGWQKKVSPALNPEEKAGETELAPAN